MKMSFLLLLLILLILAGVNVISSGMAPSPLHETISIDKLGNCPPKSKQQGNGPTQWTEQRDMDGDGITDWKWNKEYVDSDGKKVTVKCLSKEDGQFALVYEDRIVGLCPYEKGRNRATLTKDKPGGKYIKTEWFSRDKGQDDDEDKRADEMVYTYDVANDKLTALNRESNPKRDETRQTNPPPRLGSGELPVAFGISQTQIARKQQQFCIAKKNPTVELPKEGIEGQGSTKEAARNAARERAGRELCIGDKDPQCTEPRCINAKNDCVVRTQEPAFQPFNCKKVEGGFVCTMGQRGAGDPSAKVDCICTCRPKPT